jgi:hypothetical protein
MLSVKIGASRKEAGCEKAELKQSMRMKNVTKHRRAIFGCEDVGSAISFSLSDEWARKRVIQLLYER